MAQMVRFRLKDGSEVLVETEEQDAGAHVSRGKTIDAPKSFEDTLAGVRPVAEAVLEQVSALATRPAEVTVELGITLKASAGIVLASTAAEGTIKLTLKWKPGG